MASTHRDERHTEARFMPHDHLWTSESASEGDPGGAPGATAVDAGDEVAECLRRSGAMPGLERLLVVALVDVDTSALGAVAAHTTLYRLGDSQAAGHTPLHEPWLPFDDASVDGVVLYRVTSHAVDIQVLLGEASRLLRHAGRVVMIERPSDFAFAPLPEGGPAHLLHGRLREAGFAVLDVAQRAGSQVVAVAQV
jgi:SAM-dependent methyltransferase